MRNAISLSSVKMEVSNRFLRCTKTKESKSSSGDTLNAILNQPNAKQNLENYGRQEVNLGD